jgi:hypothetical protein
VDVGEAGSEERAEEFARHLGATYPIVFDPEFHLADELGARRVPTLLVVARDGSIVYSGDHFDEALTALKKLLG